MAGPWEDYQRAAPAAGPWADYAPPGQVSPGPRQTQDIGDAIMAGLQRSATGLAMRGKLPSQELPPDAPMSQRIAAGFAETAADLPLGVAAAIPGFLGGTAATANPLGGIVGAGAAGFAVPMALREGLITAYNQNNATSWEGVWQIALSSMKGFGKGAVIGGVTAGAGGIVTKAAGNVLAPMVGQTIRGGTAVAAANTAGVGTELIAMTTAASAIEGHIPTWQDFVDNAIILGGLKTAIHVASKSRNVYAQTGRKPDLVAADAKKNPEIAMEMKPIEPPVTTEPMVDAWHGSKVVFEVFDLSKVGTGDGTQTRGHGVYLGEARGTGVNYAGGLKFVDAKGAEVELPKKAELYAATAGESITGAIEAAKRIGDMDVATFFEQFQRDGGRVETKGALYRTQIPQRVVAAMADGDLTLAEQSPEVRAALDGWVRGKNATGQPLPEAWNQRLDEFMSERVRDGTAETLAHDLSRKGVPGIKYLDEGSRGEGAGTRNFVVFDPKDITIVERNGERVGRAGTTAEAALAAAETALKKAEEQGKAADIARAEMEVEARRAAAASERIARETELPRAYRQMALEERVKAAMPDLDNGQFAEVLRRVQEAELGGKEGKPLLDWSYVTDGPTLRAILAEMGAKHAAEIEAHRRGVVSDQQALKGAIDLLEAGNREPYKPGQGQSVENAFVQAAVLKDALSNARDKLVQLAGTPEADVSVAQRLEVLSALEAVAMANAEFAGGRAEAGRATRAYRVIKTDPTFLAEAEAIAKAMTRGMSLTDMARLAKDLKDPAALKKAMKGYLEATPFQKFMEVWRAGLFSGPLTWQANVLGNAGKFVLDTIEAPIQATAAVVLRGAKGDPLTFAQWKARATAPWTGLQMASLDAINSVAAGVEIVKAGGLKEGTKAFQEKLDSLLSDGDAKMDIHQRANTGALGKAVGASFGALKLQDLPFRAIAENAEKHIMAVDRAVAEGFHPGTHEGRAAIAKFYDDPTFGLSDKKANEVLSRIDAAGDRGVFSDKLGPRFAQASAAISGTWVEFLFPARRTPINLLDYAVQHTPVLNLMSSRWRADYAAGGERQAQAITRVLVGTSIAGVAMWAAQEGLLTGGGLFDKEIAGTKKGAGHQDYSIKVGDTYYNIQRMEPAGKLLMLAADLIEILNSPKAEADRSKVAAMLVLAFGNATISTTYLSGLSNAVKALVDPDRYGEQFVESYAATAIPKIVGQTAQIMDDTRREVDGVIESLQSQLPWLREQLLPKRDVWGEPVANDRFFSVMPIAKTTEADEKVKTEAARLWIGIADAPKYAIEKGPFNQRERRLELTGEQRDIFREVSGKNSLALLSPIVNHPDWERIPDFAKVKIYQKVIEGTRKQGEYASLPPDAESRAKLRDQIIIKIQQQIEAAK